MIDIDELRRRKAAGHKYVQVNVDRKSRPRSERCRVRPGVVGRYIGPNASIGGAYLVDVLIEDLLRASELPGERHE